jgi:hypothetical protein
MTVTEPFKLQPLDSCGLLLAENVLCGDHPAIALRNLGSEAIGTHARRGHDSQLRRHRYLPFKMSSLIFFPE